MTPRDKFLLAALVLKVRLFSLRQIAEQWWNGDLANTRRRLKHLAGNELIQQITVPVRTLPPVETPVFAWQPEQTPPDPSAVSYRLQVRWKGRAVRPVTAVVATAKAAQLFGGNGGGELKQPTQATHDLGVAAVWLRLLETNPNLANAWQGEDQLAHTRVGEILPDAFIVDNGEITEVIEFGGAYNAERVEEFHLDCASRDLPYQIW